MKRFFCLLPLLATLLSFTSCAKAAEDIQCPAKFYYLCRETKYGIADGVISSEERETVHIQNDLYALMQAYLKGPQTPALTRAVPANVMLETIQAEDGTLVLTLSPEFAQLSGIELSIACACLSMTLLDYTQVQTVQIIASGSSLSDSDRITMTRESVLLMDSLMITDETD